MFELGTDGPKSILVAVDGSETSLRAAAYAAGLARRQRAELIVVFVHTVPSPSAMNAEIVAAVRQADAEVVQQLRNSIQTNADRIGVDVQLVELTGEPVAEIARLADQLRVDGVIVGASTRVGRRFVGALGVHLIKLAHWPVTVVP